MQKEKSELIITTQQGATCCLYPGTPSNKNFFKGIDTDCAIAANDLTEENGIAIYSYTDLPVGIYHCTVTMEGFNAVCQIINYTEEKAVSGYRLDIKSDKLAGNGYEAGYVMLNTQEYLDKQMISQKETWGQEYAHIFNTPQFTRLEGQFGRHQQTTNEELADFIKKLSITAKYMHVFILGQTPKYGFDMPLVLFTKENIAGMTLEHAAQIIRSDGKPTIQYCAQCHSAEPASAEGALATMLSLCGNYGEHVLDFVDIYIVPRINLDGAVEAIRQSPTTMEDMNRDYLRMNNHEVQMVTSAYNLFLPEIAIDGHEKGHDVLNTGESLCTDMELQIGVGALNHPTAMRDVAFEIALNGLQKAKERGLRCHFYNRFASAAGGCAGSSYYGVRNSLSFLVETPGQVHLGMHFMERRVMSQYTFATSVIDYTVSNANRILNTVRSSREYMIKAGAVYDENHVIVVEHEKVETGCWSTPLIHVPTGEVIEQEHSVAYTEHVSAVRARPRATAYIIPKGIPNEEEILRVAECHAIGHYELDSGSAVLLKQYVQADDAISITEEQSVEFPDGAYVFPNTLPSTILGVIMEPDYNLGTKKTTLFSMGLIAANENGLFPIYRYCHDLISGKVTHI